MQKIDLEKLFFIDKNQLLGFIGFTYSFDSDYFMKTLAKKSLGIEKRSDIRDKEFFYIVTNILNNSNEFLYDRIKIYKNLKKGEIFHPKLYIIKFNDKKNIIKYRIITGSFNLTLKSLNNNLGEIGFCYETKESKQNFNKELNEFVNFVLKTAGIKNANKNLIKIGNQKDFEFIFQYNNQTIKEKIENKLMGNDIKEIHILSPYWDLKNFINKLNQKIILYNYNGKKIDKKDVKFMRLNEKSVDLNSYSQDNIEIKNFKNYPEMKKIDKELQKKIYFWKGKKYFWKFNNKTELIKKIDNYLKSKIDNYLKSKDVNVSEMKDLRKNLIEKFENDLNFYINEDKNFIHAKIYILKKSPKRNYLFLGSFNATKQGLGLNNKKNIECGVIFKNIKIGDILDNRWKKDDEYEESNKEKKNDFMEIVYLIDNFLNELNFKTKLIKSNEKNENLEIKIKKFYNKIRKLENNINKLTIEIGETEKQIKINENLKSEKDLIISTDLKYVVNGLTFEFFIKNSKGNQRIKRVVPLDLDKEYIDKIDSEQEIDRNLEDTFKEPVINEEKSIYNLMEIKENGENGENGSSDDKLKRFPFQSFVKCLCERDYYLRFYNYLKNNNDILNDFKRDYGINENGFKSILRYYLEKISNIKNKQAREIKRWIIKKFDLKSIRK